MAKIVDVIITVKVPDDIDEKHLDAFELAIGDTAERICNGDEDFSDVFVVDTTWGYKPSSPDDPWAKFVASRTEVPDLRAVTDKIGDFECDHVTPGFLYMGAYYIEVPIFWEDFPGKKRYHLTLGNEEFDSDDLGELELRLFKYAVGDGLTV